MNIVGRTIAERIKRELREKTQKLKVDLSLAVFLTKGDMATSKFIEIKKKFADEVGVSIEVKKIQNVTTEGLISKIKKTAESFDGIVVQFPLAEGIDPDAVRNVIPISHDVDVISDEAFSQFAQGELPILPPVVGAIVDIIKEHHIDVRGKQTVVVGEGRLVGKPSAVWFKKQGAHVTTVAKKSSSILEDLKRADIVVLGAGSPGLLTPDMVKDGVVIFDAGTSEASGKLVGDADPACEEKASLFTPVPGGIGPITVAMIFKNLFTLATVKIGS